MPCNIEFHAIARYLAQLKNDRDCEALINNVNNMAECYNIRAISYSGRRKPDLAMKDFDTALGSFTQSVVFICNRGRLLMKQKKIVYETSSYTKVIDTSPTQPAPYYDRAILLAATADLKNTVDDLQSFLRYSHWSGKSSAYAASMLILFLTENGQSDAALQAKADAKSKIRVSDQIPFLNYLLGRMSETSMLSVVKGSRDETKVRLMHAIDLYQRSQAGAAKKEISWVYATGDHAIDEFVLVSVYSKKVESKLSSVNVKRR